MTIIGTAHFKTFSAAASYYLSYYDGPLDAIEAVHRKIEAGEIHIGKPSLRADERCFLIDNDTRYAIERKG